MYSLPERKEFYPEVSRLVNEVVYFSSLAIIH